MESQEVAVGIEIVPDQVQDRDSQSEEVADEHSSKTANTALIEALLFASGEPLTVERLVEVSGQKKADVLAALAELAARLEQPFSGIELLEIAGKYSLRTKVEFGPQVRELKASRPRRLSAAALETLAIVAYRQPIVRADVEQIRGVDVAPTLKTLLERGLIRIVGHQPTVGQPALYGTTEQFLSLFGLRALSELPTLRDIKEFEREPGEDFEEYSGANGAESVEPVEEQVSAVGEPA